MSWTDQDPPATDVLLQGKILVGNQYTNFELDKLGSEYRATVGNLFGSHEIARHSNIEVVLGELKALQLRE